MLHGVMVNAILPGSRLGQPRTVLHSVIVGLQQVDVELLHLILNAISPFVLPPALVAFAPPTCVALDVGKPDSASSW